MYNVSIFINREINVGITCKAKDNESNFRADSGPYRLQDVLIVLIILTVSVLSRSGFVVLELTDIPGGSYTISPSTFYPGQEGPFILKVLSDCVMSFSQ